MLFDQPTIGQSQYGEYYLYAVRNGDGQTEYSFFAPTEVHEHLKGLKKGDRAIITKLAEQKGSKIITRFEVTPERQAQQTKPPTVVNGSSTQDNFYEIMLGSCKDAIRIQNELGGMIDGKSLAVTLFIARSRGTGFNGGTP
ncbi:MAG: hypothetical protein HYV28_05890 [Ignavibacteriales bacterium]|nr:hypothetical protein [Ignavibacteriales bacterium]